MRRFIVFCCLVLTSLSLFAGCSQKVALHQPSEEIVKIDLIYSPFNQFDVLYSLSDIEIKEFADAVSELTLRKNGSPVSSGGTYIIRITYADGAVELLGSWSVSYTCGETVEHDGWYYVSENDLFNLFSQYIDLNQIPDM